jgi:hypothetical protein
MSLPCIDGACVRCGWVCIQIHHFKSSNQCCVSTRERRLCSCFSPSDTVRLSGRADLYVMTDEAPASVGGRRRRQHQRAKEAPASEGEGGASIRGRRRRQHQRAKDAPASEGEGGASVGERRRRQHQTAKEAPASEYWPAAVWAAVAPAPVKGAAGGIAAACTVTKPGSASGEGWGLSAGTTESGWAPGVPVARCGAGMEAAAPGGEAEAAANPGAGCPLAARAAATAPSLTGTSLPEPAATIAGTPRRPQAPQLTITGSPKPTVRPIAKSSCNGSTNDSETAVMTTAAATKMPSTQANLPASDMTDQGSSTSLACSTSCGSNGT